MLVCQRHWSRVLDHPGSLLLSCSITVLRPVVGLQYVIDTMSVLGNHYILEKKTKKDLTRDVSLLFLFYCVFEALKDVVLILADYIHIL